jgi:hypothetical protein
MRLNRKVLQVFFGCGIEKRPSQYSEERFVVTYLLGGFPPRPPPDLPPVEDGHPAPFGFIGGCPLCLGMNITSFMLL